MKKKTIFGGILLLIILSLACISITVLLAFFAGSVEADLFNFKNLNWSNMIPIFLVGGMLSCFVVGIAVLFVSRTVFFKVKDYITEINEKKGNEK